MTITTPSHGANALSVFQVVEAERSCDAIGNRELLQSAKTGLLCSRKCPASIILDACDRFQEWAGQADLTVVSAFHSPVEQECLRTLLKGAASIVVCPAREIRHMRIPPGWKPALAAGRMLILSPFSQKRAHAAVIDQRNAFVAEIADTLYIPYAGAKGRLAALQKEKHAAHL